MSIETLIPLVVKHNSLIIQSLVSFILFLVMVMAYRNFLRAKHVEEQAAHGGGPDLGNLEETLKKLLEKANQVPTAAAVSAGGGGADSAALAAEIENLRLALQEKQDLIEQLKSAPAPAPTEAAPVAAAAGMSDEEKNALNGQIKDLQAKLSEYEIISEDIADLSRFKDENSKLQAEIAALKAGGASAMAAVVEAAAPEPEPTPAPEPVAAAPVAAAPVAVEEAPVETAPVEAAAEPAPAASEPAAAAAPAITVETQRPDPAAVLSADDDLIREFAEAVSAQSGTSASGDATEKKIIDTMEALPAEKTTLDESAADSLFDVERMTAEAGELVAKAESGPAISAAEALGESLDPDKIAEEAAKMGGIKPEDAQLMGEFEDFMKKGGNG